MLMFKKKKPTNLKLKTQINNPTFQFKELGKRWATQFQNYPQKGNNKDKSRGKWSRGLKNNGQVGETKINFLDKIND